MRIVAGIAACLVLLASAPVSAQERFDLRDWSRKALPDTPTALFDCKQPKSCGVGSVISARLIPLPKEPLTVSNQKVRQQGIVRRMREQGEGRLKDIEVDEPRETKIEGMQFIYTEKRVIPQKGATRTYVDGILVGKTKAYLVVSSGPEAARVRDNFNGLALVTAFVLDQMALETPPPETASAPSSQ
jgi:hypothetical protein